MTQREKILAAAVLALLVLWGAKSLLGRHYARVAERRSQLSEARQQLSDAKLALAVGQHALKQMEKWQEQSLPADRDVAVSLYRSWLLDQLKAAGLSVDDVKPDIRATRGGDFTTIGYVVEAHGTLEAVASLLYEFYRSPQLQQIVRLRLRPGTDESQLDVSLQVEALILPGAAETDKLPEGETERPALADVAEYRQSLADRNLFAAYKAGQGGMQGNVASLPADDAQHAYVTGIVQNGDKLQVWITVRTTGEVLRLHEGDTLKVGKLEGRIVSIAPRMVVLESGDQQREVKLGSSLREEEGAARKQADENRRPGDQETGRT